MSNISHPSPPTSLTCSLHSLLTSPLLHPTLDSYAHKIFLDNSAQVLTTTISLARSLNQWILSSHRDEPYSITIPHPQPSLPNNGTEPVTAPNPICLQVSGAKFVDSIPDDAFTHVFSKIFPLLGKDDKEGRKAEILRELKKVYYALKPKGYAIVICVEDAEVLERVVREVMLRVGAGRREGKGERGEGKVEAIELKGERKGGGAGRGVSEGELVELAEEAQFERGKIRCFGKDVTLQGGIRDELVSELREGLRCVVGGDGARGEGLDGIVDEVLDEELKRTDGVIMRAKILMMMKWDLLCA